MAFFEIAATIYLILVSISLFKKVCKSPAWRFELHFARLEVLIGSALIIGLCLIRIARLLYTYGNSHLMRLPIGDNLYWDFFFLLWVICVAIIARRLVDTI